MPRIPENEIEDMRKSMESSCDSTELSRKTQIYVLATMNNSICDLKGEVGQISALLHQYINELA